MREHACPICRQGTLERLEGRLEQSGDSYLPTAVWRCPRCEYARYEPVPRAHWVPAEAPVAVMPATRVVATPRQEERPTAASPLAGVRTRAA